VKARRDFRQELFSAECRKRILHRLLSKFRAAFCRLCISIARQPFPPVLHPQRPEA
jgi:hypothetical protein